MSTRLDLRHRPTPLNLRPRLGSHDLWPKPTYLDLHLMSIYLEHLFEWHISTFSSCPLVSTFDQGSLASTSKLAWPVSTLNRTQPVSTFSLTRLDLLSRSIHLDFQRTRTHFYLLTGSSINLC